MFNRILVATDGSEGAVHAVQTAVLMADRYHAELIALYVYEIPTIVPMMAGAGGIGGLEYIDPALMEEWEQAAQQRVEESVKQTLGDRPVKYTFRAEAGHPAQTISRIAEDEHCDLLVIGSRGLSGLKAFFLGSVSERVAHLAHCSVLIVR